jgi:hypothetical protein
VIACRGQKVDFAKLEHELKAEENGEKLDGEYKQS